MAAALRLLERGYRVTLYEEKNRVGGNLAGFEADGVRYDVYPHMFGDWYRNFWNLVENDLKLERGDSDSAAFQPRYMFKVLDRGAFPNYIDLLNVESPVSAPWTSLFSGFASPAEMFLWAYSTIDGLSYSRVDDDVLDRISVEGFLRTRPYATSKVAELHDSVLMNIWSVHGTATSSAAYRRFLEHNAPLPSPLVWLLTGNLGTKLMDPLRRKIEALGGTFQTDTRVVEVVLTDSDAPGTPARATALKIKATKYDQKTEKVRAVGETITLPLGPDDSIILAVSPTALGYLVTSGVPDHRIVDKLPALSQVRRLAAEPIPVLNLYFKRKLPDIP
jgi:zeta-carotene desaturase